MISKVKIFHSLTNSHAHSNQITQCCVSCAARPLEGGFMQSLITGSQMPFLTDQSCRSCHVDGMPRCCTLSAKVVKVKILVVQERAHSSVPARNLRARPSKGMGNASARSAAPRSCSARILCVPPAPSQGLG